jgi:hypothetical protein
MKEISAGRCAGAMRISPQRDLCGELRRQQPHDLGNIGDVLETATCNPNYGLRRLDL